ncbi:zinc finger protein 672-like, partial [Diachasmimorpha longicaudata]|uniref:zinc finger protein 672-like n=1 Tax=Diachasmimorpha longicaudata TaxID=58733 RepID=UPI0030B87273
FTGTSSPLTPSGRAHRGLKTPLIDSPSTPNQNPPHRHLNSPQKSFLTSKISKNISNLKNIYFLPQKQLNSDVSHNAPYALVLSKDPARQYVCIYCRTAYTKPHILKKHMMSTCYWNPHSRASNNPKPFPCTQCSSSFNHQSLLTRHMNVDCGRIHRCNRCLSTFNHLNSLQKHKSRFGGWTYPRDMDDGCLDPCEDQGKCQLMNQRVGGVRMAPESDYKCWRCGARYNRLSNLRAHVRDDCGRVHQCEECRAIFKQRSGLYHHRKRCRMLKTLDPSKFLKTLTYVPGALDVDICSNDPLDPSDIEILKVEGYQTTDSQSQLPEDHPQEEILDDVEGGMPQLSRDLHIPRMSQLSHTSQLRKDETVHILWYRPEEAPGHEVSLQEIPPHVPLRGKGSLPRRKNRKDQLGNERYPCPNCMTDFKYLFDLTRHQKFRCGQEARFMCPYCGQMSKVVYSLYRHIRSRHRGQTVYVVNANNGEKHVARTYPCPSCRSVFGQRRSLATHLRYECGQPPRFMCPYYHWDNPYTISIKTFPPIVEPKRFPCPKCSCAYNRRDNLLMHLRNECGRLPKFKCPYCGYRSKKTSNVRAHIRNVHSGSQIYVIDIERVEQQKMRMNL